MYIINLLLVVIHKIQISCNVKPHAQVRVQMVHNPLTLFNNFSFLHIGWKREPYNWAIQVYLSKLQLTIN